MRAVRHRRAPRERRPVLRRAREQVDAPFEIAGWDELMDELRAVHLGTATPERAGRTATEWLAAAYAAAVAQNPNAPGE